MPNKAGKKRTSTASQKKTGEKEELISNVREDNLLNEPAEGKKASGLVDENKLVSPIDDPSNPQYIPPPSVSDDGSRTHHIRASRGEEVPFYNVPQSGIFNNTNLKA